ncbi:hypothetical protein PG605_04695 [Riemerella anatipestifer]|nr:hypothetical protein [Riemerella anatipestifer]MDY3348926.1 hypothetical protein [Riemerella anatipestifer]
MIKTSVVFGALSRFILQTIQKVGYNGTSMRVVILLHQIVLL